jgi:hypothetical protein
MRWSVMTSKFSGYDLRHTFAVRQLLQWHRDGADVNARMLVLSACLGHVSPAGTYWYLTAAPELMEPVAARLPREDRSSRPPGSWTGLVTARDTARASSGSLGGPGRCRRRGCAAAIQRHR